jgi:hypothetical protein
MILLHPSSHPLFAFMWTDIIIHYTQQLT